MITTLICIAVYFLPTIIATLREHKDWLAIFTVDLLVGWTVIGWIIALVWSCTNGK